MSGVLGRTCMISERLSPQMRPAYWRELDHKHARGVSFGILFLPLASLMVSPIDLLHWYVGEKAPPTKRDDVAMLLRILITVGICVG